MGRLGLVGASYQSQSPNANAENCVNWYVENDESGSSKSARFLYPTPGLQQFYLFPTALTSRGSLEINGRLFLCAGNALDEVDGSGKQLHTYQIPNDDLPVSMASSNTQILIITAGIAYVLDITTNTLTPVDPTMMLGTPYLAGYSDGYFIILLANSAQFQISALNDATSWNGLDTARVSEFPDNVLSMIIDHREIWVFGRKRTVVYFNSGNPDFPFIPIPSGCIENGIAGPLARDKMDNSIFWLDGDERGSGILRRANGYLGQRVSNHAVEYQWSQYPKLSDAEFYTYKDQGHEFLVIYFPSANKTWVYDAATSLFHERARTDAIYGQLAHSSHNHAYCFGKHIVGDPASGMFYEMNINFTSDAGNPIRRVRRAPHISNEQEWIYHSQLQIDLEAGLGTILGPGLSSGPQSVIVEEVQLVDGKLVPDLGDWRLTIADNGTPTLVSVDPHSAGPVFPICIQNSQTGKAYVIVVPLGSGALFATPTAFNPAYPSSFLMQTSPTGLQTAITVDNNGAVHTSAGVATVARPALGMLRWSDDGGHTWSNEHELSAGKIGEYRQRVILQRLGRSRDRVYELAVSDNIPWRVIDAYLKATGFQPTERLTSKLRQMA